MREVFSVVFIATVGDETLTFQIDFGSCMWDLALFDDLYGKIGTPGTRPMVF
jgi:hypothetical protein